MHKYIFYTNTIFKGVFILVSVNLYSTKTGEIKSFLESFFDEPVYLKIVFIGQKNTTIP